MPGRAASPARTSSRRRPSRLPTFALYGEEGAAPPPLHIESIDSRSRLYDWEIDAHVHQGLHQVLWLHAGEVDAVLDESRRTAPGPAVVVIPPGVAHAFRFSRGSDGFVLTFDAAVLAEGDADDAGEALRELFAAPRLFAPERDAPEVARLHALFQWLHAENHAAGAGPDPVPIWLARAVVHRLARAGRRGLQAQRRGAAGRQSLYTRWVVLVEAHYQEHWPVSRYAERLGLSTERLNRVVRAETGRSAQQLVHERLVREACRRLVHVAAPVSRLAFELGFDDPAYFCRFFKRHAGVSPRQYRAHAQAAQG